MPYVQSSSKAEEIEIVEKFYAFGQEWIPSCCVRKKNCKVNKDKWVPHGIFLSGRKASEDIASTYINYCVEGVPPYQEVENVICNNIDLNTRWYSFSNDNDATLYKNEFTKHGSCLILHKAFKDQREFMCKVMDLEDKYPVGEFLRVGGIVPSNEEKYSIRDIHNAIKTKLKLDEVDEVAPMLIFEYFDDSIYLKEIQICFDTDWKPVDASKVYRGVEYYYNKNTKYKDLDATSKLIIYPTEDRSRKISNRKRKSENMSKTTIGKTSTKKKSRLVKQSAKTKQN